MINLRTLTLSCVTAVLGSGVAAQDVTKLVVWGDAVREPFYQAFDAARDDVEVEMVTIAPTEIITKLQLAMQSGDGIPDAIFMPDVNMAAQLSTRRVSYLLELSDKVDPAVVDEFYPTALAPCEKANGSLICLRNDVAHFMLWYNAPLMEELGLSLPTTWQEYEAVGAAAAAKDSGIVVGASSIHMTLMNYLMSNGCNVAIPLADDPETLQVNALAPQCVESAQLVDRMLESGALYRGSPFDPEFVEKARANKLLMIPGPTWFGEYVLKRNYEFAEGQTGVAPQMKWDSQDTPVIWSWGGGVWGAWKDTKHLEAVVDLLEFVTSDQDINSTAVTMPANQPASLPWGAALNATGYYANDDAFEQMVDAAAFGHHGYVSLRFDSRAAFTKAVANDLAAGASFESLLPQLQEEIVNAAKLARYKVVTE